MSKVTWVMVDVETTGPCPGIYSMVEIGAIVIEPSLDKTFYVKMAPEPGSLFDPGAMQIMKYDLRVLATWPEPKLAMLAFEQWLREIQNGSSGLKFVTDTAGFDYAFVNYYFWKYCKENPFGHSAVSLGSLYKGCVRDMYKNFKHLRVTKHTHNPVDDARGNAEAFLAVMNQYGIAGGPKRHDA